MSWHYLRVAGGESLQDICLGGDVLQPLKSKTIHDEFYCNGSLMDSYLDSLSGTMSQHLTENLGAEKSMSSQGVFLARTLALQAEAQDLTENNPQCGITWRGWLAKFDQDSYSWKTAQCSFIEESGESLVTFPVSGMTRSGLLWELPMLAHRTSATERGLWRTPDTGGGDAKATLSGQDSSSEWSLHPDKVTRSSEQSQTLADTSTENVQRQGIPLGVRQERDTPSGSGWWAVEPRLGRVAHGVAHRVDRLKAIGNGQVPLCAATAWRLLNDQK
jgi:hypothetical protein